jgi:hypothetical protein
LPFLVVLHLETLSVKLGKNNFGELKVSYYTDTYLPRGGFKQSKYFLLALFNEKLYNIKKFPSSGNLETFSKIEETTL